MIEGVIFDMDGLMFDTERLWDTFWEPACAALGVPMPADTAAFYAGGRGLAGEKLKAHLRAFFPGVDAQKMLDKVWQIGQARFAQGVPCKPGLQELLALLEERGIPRIAVFPRRGVRGGRAAQQTRARYLFGGRTPPAGGHPPLPGAGGQL